MVYVILAITDNSLLKFFFYLSTCRLAPAPRIGSWIQGGMLQLQHRACQTANQGSWMQLKQEVPITKNGE